MRPTRVGDRIILKDMTVADFSKAKFPPLIQPGRIFRVRQLWGSGPHGKEDMVYIVEYRHQVWALPRPIDLVYFANLSILGEEIEQDKGLEEAKMFYEKYHIWDVVDRLKTMVKHQEYLKLYSPDKAVEHLRTEVEALKGKVEAGDASISEISEVQAHAKAVERTAKGKADKKTIKELETILKEMECVGGVTTEVDNIPGHRPPPIVKYATMDQDIPQASVDDARSSAMSICPYCGKDFDFPKPPRFCPYCKERLMR